MASADMKAFSFYIFNSEVCVASVLEQGLVTTLVLPPIPIR